MFKNEQMSKKAFLEQVARMYYVLGLNQQEIAKQLQIGRSSVARFLNEAREAGIIRFQIDSPVDHLREAHLERKLARAYPLKDCVIFADRGGNMQRFDSFACQYLNTVLPFSGSIGLGWGRTLFSVGQSMHLADSRPHLQIVQLSGSSGEKETVFPAAANIQTWAQGLGSATCFLPAPAIVDPEDKPLFLKNQTIRRAFESIRQVDVAIVGIGDTGEHSTILESKMVPELTSAELKKYGVGDVIFHFFNAKGQFSFPSLSERVIGATEEDFMNIPMRIGIAYGLFKREAIRGALAGGIINVLITDGETARALLL
ncbi:hypothetical protein EWH99_00015 [Sporolactobacillus sp. THM7-7]|nr:hypothetical protein EWH99_00015 [Sporolactobacillus sp. THM7-7]